MKRIELIFTVSFIASLILSIVGTFNEGINNYIRIVLATSPFITIGIFGLIDDLIESNKKKEEGRE